MIDLDRWVAIAFSILLLVLGGFVALLGSIHGPDRFASFVFAYAFLAVGLLWTFYWFVGRRGYRHRALLLAAMAILLAVALVGASQASLGFLIDWEVARQERIAAATQVFNMRDEPLLSAKGNVIGVRLRYSMRFPNSDYFWHTPSLRAAKDFGAGLWVDGRFAEPSVTPPMQSGKYGAPRYEQGRQYDFAADVLPYFLVWNKDKTKLCSLDPPREYQAGFERLLGGESIHYKINVNGTKFEGETTNAYSPKVFYENALKEGAVKLDGSGLGGSVGRCE